MNGLFRISLKSLLSSKNYRLSFIVLILIMLLAHFVNVLSFYGDYDNFVPNGFYHFIGFSVFNSQIKYSLYYIVLPLVVSFGAGTGYIFDTESGLRQILLTKSRRKTYYLILIITTFLSGFILVFLPFLVNLVLSLIAFPLDSTTFYANNISMNQILWIDNLVFKTLHINNPLIYSLLYCLIPAVVGGLLSCITLCFSFFYQKNVITTALVVPFIYVLLTIFTNYTHHPNLTLPYYLMAVSPVTSLNFVYLSFMLVILLVIIYFVFLIQTKRDEL